MKKLIVFVAIIFLTACGSGDSQKGGFSQAQLDKKETVTQEEVIAANKYDGEVVKVDKEVEFHDFLLHIDHYYRTDEIYEIDRANHLRVMRPESGKEYIVLYLKTTNNSGEENPKPYIFNLVGDNEVHNSLSIPRYNNAFEKVFPAVGLATEKLLDGGSAEGYLVMELSKDDENPSLRLIEMGVFSNPETLDIPLTNQ